MDHLVFLGLMDVAYIYDEWVMLWYNFIMPHSSVNGVKIVLEK